MTRFRSLALSITLALLVTGCYTQLRAPHASSQHRDIRVPTRRAHTWRHHRPVFHIPAYSHYDGWLYGDSYCDIWVDRYTDYHPWIPGHGVQVFFDVHAHPGRDLWRGNRYGRTHRRNGRNDYGGYGRHRGPRFEPLSPTVEVAIEVVEHRGKFRRSGFAAGVPGRGEGLVPINQVGEPEDIVTMQGISVSADANGHAATQTVRVTRPRKIRRALGNTVAVAGGADLLNQEITWESWQERRQTPNAQNETRPEKQSGWGDSGRDLQTRGPEPKVDERPTRQPKPQTNWFNPTDTQTNTASPRVEKRERSWRPAETDETEEKDLTEQRSNNPVSESWSPDVTDKKSAVASDYVSPKKGEWERVRPDRNGRRDDSPKPEVRDPKPASRTRAETKNEKREKPKPDYAAPRKEERSKERVSRAPESEKSQKKETEKKDEKKKETRKEKRKKTRKRRGM